MFTLPLIIKSAVFVTPLAPPEGNRAAFLKSSIEVGFVVVQENP